MLNSKLRYVYVEAILCRSDTINLLLNLMFPQAPLYNAKRTQSCSTYLEYSLYTCKTEMRSAKETQCLTLNHIIHALLFVWGSNSLFCQKKVLRR